MVELATGRFPFCDLSDDDDLSDLDDYATALAEQNKTLTHRDSLAFKTNKEKRKSRRKSKGGFEAFINQADSLNSMSIIELMHQIVREPAPRLGPQFEEEAEEFVDACLAKNPDERHGPKTLLVGVLRFQSDWALLDTFCRNTAGWTTPGIQLSILKPGRKPSNCIATLFSTFIQVTLTFQSFFPDIAPLFCISFIR